MTPHGGAQHPCIVLPVYEDWAAVSKLLTLIDQALAAARRRGHVILVDDGSVTPCTVRAPAAPFEALLSVRLLTLRRNLGHQRAIAVALAHLHSKTTHETIVVMDADGEDNPADVPRLLQEYEAGHGSRIVFAARHRRSELLFFRIGYFLYRHLHRLLTGIPVRVGNFSVIPRPLLGRLVVVSELWNHYAAAVFLSRLPHTSIPTERAKRLDGRSHMNVTALVVHGLSAITVHSEVIGVRLLLASLALAAVSAAAIGGVVWIRAFTDLAIPGWATGAVGMLVLVILSALMLAVGFSMTAMTSRRSAGFIPERDHQWFVGGTTDIYVADV